MIIGLFVRVVLELCRRRGMRVPDVSRLRRRRPRVSVTEPLVAAVVERADRTLPRRER